jgi:hypothetical protein
VDTKAYFKRFSELCPGVAVNVETISGFAVEFPYLESEFWEVFPDKPAAEFARFLALAKKGRQPAQQTGTDQERQRSELERSIEYLKTEVGLGTKR